MTDLKCSGSALTSHAKQKLKLTPELDSEPFQSTSYWTVRFFFRFNL